MQNPKSHLLRLGGWKRLMGRRPDSRRAVSSCSGTSINPPQEAANRKGNRMKPRFIWASAVALVVIIAASQRVSMAATNGVILITTRKGQDLTYGTTDAYDQKGPGQVSQGDAAMQELLGNNGYSCRLIMDAQLGDASVSDNYLAPADPNFAPVLIIVSGSSGSADVPRTLDKGLPVMMGEHSCLGDRANLAATSDLFMYSGGTTSGNITDTAAPPGGQYMKVTQEGKNHPILQGIPLDSQDRIKIFRDPYPDENAHVPLAGKKNYQYSWTAIDAAGAAGTGTTVLGLLDSNTNKAVFGVNDIGGLLAFDSNLGYAGTNTVRLVHWIVNEDGSGGARRMFNALTEAGRLIFLRTVKWALGEALTPVKTFKVIDVTSIGSGTIQISWEGSAAKNYRLLANNDLTTADWQTVVEDIHGIDGVVTRRFDISAGPQTLFMRIKALP